MFQRFLVGLAVEYSSCFISVKNLDFICLLFLLTGELEVLYADRITCMCMNHGRTQCEVARIKPVLLWFIQIVNVRPLYVGL